MNNSFFMPEKPGCLAPGQSMQYQNKSKMSMPEQCGMVPEQRDPVKNLSITRRGLDADAQLCFKATNDLSSGAMYKNNIKPHISVTLPKKQ